MKQINLVKQGTATAVYFLYKDSGQQASKLAAVIPSQPLIMATNKSIAIKSQGAEVLRIAADDEVYLDSQLFSGDLEALALELTDNFFFDNLEGFQKEFLFDAPATGDTFILLPKTLPYEIGASYSLKSRCYMEGPNDSTYSSIVESGSIARCYDIGNQTPNFTGSPNTQPAPTIVTGGPALAAFIVASNGELYYRIQPNASVPALSCRLLFSVIKF